MTDPVHDIWLSEVRGELASALNERGIEYLLIRVNVEA